jgi:hypothetical protein
MPSVMAGTELSSNEFCNSLTINCGCSPTRLHPNCEGWDLLFTAHHELSCAKDRLVIIMHNELCDELISMASKALSPLVVHIKPKINLCCNTTNGSIKPEVDTKDRCDVLIMSL